MAVFKENSRRTLVEFYDAEYLENIVSLLCGSYTDVVYVYFARGNVPTEQDCRALSEFVKDRFGFAPKFLKIEEHTVECALKAFRKLVGNGQRYDFDITGGSSVFVAAAGALAVSDGGKRIRLHEYDPVRGMRVFSYPAQDEAAKQSHTAEVTVDQMMALRGIEMLYSERPVRHQLNRDGLREEVLRLWDAIRGELKAWNRFSVLPAKTKPCPGGYCVSRLMDPRTRSACSKLLEKLEKSGIISGLREQERGKEIELTYNLNVPQCALFLYDKGGSILEMLTYVTAVDSGRFSDCCIGLSVDWKNGDRTRCVSPNNEIDTVLIRGYLPYFISCKNGDVKNDFLYEIMVMARHYGGEYAVPVLLCTTKCKAHFHARAKEMGVTLMDGIAAMNAETFAKALIAGLCGTK